MGLKISEKMAELRIRIDEILFYVWDPIGVNDTPLARDEYYSYIPTTYKLAQETECITKVSEYLNTMETVNMGLSSNMNRCIVAAEYICEWCEELGMNNKS